MFTRADISEQLHRQPFRPLRIVTSSGESYEVKHPELVMVGKRELAIGISTARDPQYYERLALVPFLHVSAIEYLAVDTSRPPQEGNGD